jgi:hypothetical protein
VNTPCEDRRFFIEAGWKCKVVNDINDFVWDVDYDYYVERAWKLINFADENSSQEKAIERARSLFKQQENLPFHQQNPGTKVYELVEELNENLRR